MRPLNNTIPNYLQAMDLEIDTRTQNFLRNEVQSLANELAGSEIREKFRKGALVTLNGLRKASFPRSKILWHPTNRYHSYHKQGIVHSLGKTVCET
jgi:hypothetical protein